MNESIIRKNAFSKTIIDLLKKLNSFPELLRKDVSAFSEIKKKLRSQGNPDSQGTGNQVTDQETCFAALLEEYNFRYSNSPTEDGNYYIYQLNGTQRSIDFQVYHLQNNTKQEFINFDLKHTKSDIFFLNDGWFNQNVIYIISWMYKTSEPRKKKVVQPATFIALGQDIPTQEETDLHNIVCDFKKKCNTEYKGVGSFHCYLRFANTYKCTRFIPSFSTDCLNNVIVFMKTKQITE